MDETIGQRLRRLRSARGLSQRELSTEHVSYAYISRIEAGARRPSVKALRELAPKLGVSVHYLETGSDDPLWTAWLLIFALMRERDRTRSRLRALRISARIAERDLVEERGSIDRDLIEVVRDAAVETVAGRNGGDRVMEPSTERRGK